MSSSSRPPSPPDSSPENSPWAAAARALATNPDSPESLRILSAVNSALAPRTKAIQQLVDALEDQQAGGAPAQAADAAVAAAIAHWEKACGGPMDAQTLELLRADAAAQARARRNRPPPMADILSAMPAATDLGYGLGLDLTGIEGTWHRLWALMSLTVQFGDDPEMKADSQLLLREFESLLGRQMQPAEIAALWAHARQHAHSHPMGHSNCDPRRLHRNDPE